MKIKEASKACGLSEKSIRYYEGMELLQVKRTENGYRIYADKDILRLKEIALFRSLNASIEDMNAYYENRITLDEFLSKLLVKQQTSINTTKDAIAFTKNLQLHHDMPDFSIIKEYEKRIAMLNASNELEEIESEYLSKGKKEKRNVLLLIIMILGIAFLLNTNFDKDIVYVTLITIMFWMIIILLFPSTYEVTFKIIKFLFRFDIQCECLRKRWRTISPNFILRTFMSLLCILLLIFIIFGVCYLLT